MSNSAGNTVADMGLRIGFVTWDFPVISETFVSTLAADLVAAGSDLSILSYNPGPDRASPSSIHPEILAAGLPERTRRACDTPASFGSWKAAVLSGVARVVPRNLIAAAQLAASAGPFDIVHCQFGTLGLAALRHRNLGLLRTRALVVHFRGYDITQFVGEHGEHVYDGVFRQADLMIANSSYFRDCAVAIGCPAEKICVIGSPIDVARFAPPRQRVTPTDGSVRLVAVGRLVEKKGFVDAVSAVAVLRGQGVDAHLEVLGDGPLRESLEEQIAKLDLTGFVRLRGRCTQDQVISALHRADIALAPSVTASDGDSDAAVNTLKEAMSTQLPVIATQHGGIPELVKHGENGFLVPERDAHAIARAVSDLAANPAQRAAMGEAGRRAVAELFDRHKICEQTLAAYRRCLG